MAAFPFMMHGWIPTTRQPQCTNPTMFELNAAEFSLDIAERANGEDLMCSENHIIAEQSRRNGGPDSTLHFFLKGLDLLGESSQLVSG